MALLLAATPLVWAEGNLIENSVEVLDEANTVTKPPVSVEESTEALKMQMKEQLKATAKQKLEAATPEEIKQGTKMVEKGAENLKKAKQKMKELPKSTDDAAAMAKTKAKQKAAEKALELLR